MLALAAMAMLTGALLAAGPVLLSGGAQASAPPDLPPPDGSARSSLTLSVSEGRTVVPVGRFVRLWCDPAGGTHPAPHAACRALARAGGQFDELRGRAGLCPAVYRPVSVSVDGTYDGRDVFYHQTFSNRCKMLAELGVVFRF